MITSSDVPILTFGFERSGTTLLSMLLGSHPDLAVPFSPTGLWYRYHHSLEDYGHLRQETDRDRLVTDILQEERIRLWDVTPDFEDIKRRATNADFSAIVAAFHAQYASQQQKSRWALHDIGTLYNMHIANEWFPDARFLHIVRDVRDIAFSHKGYRYGSSNGCEVAVAWRDAVRTNMMMGKMIGDGRYRVIRFEDLIESPEQTLEDICRFFGLEFDRKMLDYSDDVDRKVPDDKKTLWPALGGKLDSSKIGQWRHKLKPREIAAIDEITEELMTELAYETRGGAGSIAKELHLVSSVLSRGARLNRVRRLLKLS
ncbi:MAG: sulfotransferase [Pseudomonadota bacterium]